MTSDLVSVVVTTKNEQSNIERCLQSICTQTYEPIEIILVDNGSTDLTRQSPPDIPAMSLITAQSGHHNAIFGMIAKAQGEFGNICRR